MGANTLKKSVKKKKFGKKRLNRAKRSRILDLSRVNLSPLPVVKIAKFQYVSGFNISAPGIADYNRSCYFSLGSLYDPDYSNTGRNNSVSWFGLYLGSTNGLYEKFRVIYVDVEIKVLNPSSGTRTTFVASVTQNGVTDYPASTYISSIAQRPMALRRDLEYVGDAKYSKLKFRVYLNKVFGLTYRQYMDDNGKLRTYNDGSSTAPWLALTSGDANDSINSGASQGIVKLTYHVRLSDPFISNTTM